MADPSFARLKPYQAYGLGIKIKSSQFIKRCGHKELKPRKGILNPGSRGGKISKAKGRGRGR